MPICHASIQTDNPTRLMKRLCKHWGHKFPVQLAETECAIELGLGTCRMQCDAQLHVELEGDEQTMAQFQQVVADHLHRMANRETLSIEWR